MVNISTTTMLNVITSIFPTQIRNTLLAIVFFFGCIGVGVIANNMTFSPHSFDCHRLCLSSFLYHIDGYIRHYEKWLPKLHYFISEVKIQLVQQIGKDPKELMIVSDELLCLKMEYARDLIELYKLLAPCEIRMLGMLCFELHSAIAENSRRISLQTTLSPKNLLLYVEQSVEYLQHESDIFIEDQILKQAKINRDALKMFIRM